MADEFGDQLTIVEYHPSSSDPLVLAWSVARGSFYGNRFPGYPTVIFDGAIDEVGSWGTPAQNAQHYRDDINARLAIGANVSVEGIFNYSTENVSLTAKAKKVDNVVLTSPMLVMAVLEDDIHSGGRIYNHVVRAGGSQNITLTNVGDSVVVSMDFPIRPTWNMENIHCVAWVQRSTGNLWVYQAADLTLFTDFTFDFEDNLITIPEGNGEAIFEGTLTSQYEAAQDITVSLNNTFGWPCEFMVEGEAEFHSDPSVVSLAPAQQLGITMRVTTDEQRRIGSGSLVLQSPNRVATKSCRIFNGGPAILMVDDDGRYPTDDEAPILAALDAANALYDHWDVRLDYGRAPTVDEMCQYDAAIWHVGRQSGMIDDSDVQLFTDYLDSGGGLILSYQQFMNFADTCSVPVVPAFVHDYLGIDDVAVDAGADSALGVPGDPITDGMNIYFNYSSSVLNKADALTLNTIGVPILHNSAGGVIGVRADLQGAVLPLRGSARVVFFPCFLNALQDSSDPDNLKTLLDNSIEWVLARGSAGIGDQARSHLSAIRSIAPNPLSMSYARGTGAAIRLRVSDAVGNNPVRLDVFDLNGRLVRNLIDGSLPAGTADANWDGRESSGQPVGSGMYYLRFTTPEGIDRAPIVVIR